MTDPVDRAATDQLTVSPTTAIEASSTSGGASDTSGLASRVRQAGTERAKRAASTVLDKVGDRAAASVSGDVAGLHREIERLRAEIDTLRGDVAADMALLRAELAAHDQH